MRCAQHVTSQAVGYMTEENVIVLMCSRCSRAAVEALGVMAVHIKPLPGAFE